MRLRWKLLLLLLAISMAPMALLTATLNRGTLDLGNELAERARDALTERARHQLGRLVEQHAATVGRRADLLTLILEVQAAAVERALASPSPPAGAPLYAGDLVAFGAWGFGQEQAATITHPALILSGAQSHPVYVEINALLCEWLPNAEPSTLAGTAHMMQVDNPEGTSGALLAFLARHPMS